MAGDGRTGRRAAAARARRAIGVRTTALAASTARRPAGVVALTAVVATTMALALGVLSGGGGARVHRAVAAAARTTGIGRQETAQILAEEQGAARHLAPATSAPAPTPAAVDDQPPMRPHEVFGFAPYWTLADQQNFDVAGFTTIAYFGLGVNGNGTLDETGTGWSGYESQALADLVDRAHAAGDRVVLTVECFAQPLLDQLTSSPSAARTLASQVVAAIRAKHLDGVNVDFEGVGAQDAPGLTSLVGTVAHAVHAYDAHDQVTVDTYGSSAAGPPGFYDIPALAKVVNGFFVMAYDLNLASDGTGGSPMTSTELPDAAAAAEYAAAVPPQMVILGSSWYGYDWPTTNGSLDARPMGSPTPVSFGQVRASGRPIYWDPVTQTPWTSYESGGQWYEAYFEDPESVYLEAELARHYGFGTGAWALGMDGDDPAMTLAVDGTTPGTGTGPLGPAWTPPSVRASSPSGTPRQAAGTSPAPDVRNGPAKPAPGSKASTTTTTTQAGSGTSTSTTSTTTSTTSTTTTTTTTAPPGATTYTYSGVFGSTKVTLTRVKPTSLPSGAPILVGTLSSFATDDPAVACLESTPVPPDVVRYGTSPTYVVRATRPGNCVTAAFTFPVSSVPAAPSG